MKDWVLFAIVVVVVVGDLAIITIGTAVPSSRLNATIINDIEHPDTVIVSSTLIGSDYLNKFSSPEGKQKHQICRVHMYQSKHCYLAGCLLCLQGSPSTCGHVHGLPHS